MLTIYKCFRRTHLDYDDIIYDQAFHNSFHRKIEFQQYNAALVITDAIRGTANSIFGYHNPIRLKLLTRLRYGLGHLREHKFKYSFQDKLNPLCSCRKEAETNFRFLLLYSSHSDERLTLLSKITNMNPNILGNNNIQMAFVIISN